MPSVKFRCFTRCDVCHSHAMKLCSGREVNKVLGLFYMLLNTDDATVISKGLRF